MQPFQRLRVEYVVTGGTRVWWDMERHFVDPGPYVFQLQAGHTALNDADDWENVGSAVTDTYMTFDLTKRLFGKTDDVHYRVLLTTAVGSYTSMTAAIDGLLSKRDWLNYREIARKEALRHQVLTSPVGFLLKVRRYGPRCPACADKFTEETTWTNCPTCFGTGFKFGYFDPLPACYADVSIEQNREHRNPNVGMEKQDTITARFFGDPQLYSYDVWCNAMSDQRYYIHTVSTKALVRGVTLIYEAELRLAPYTDVIYTLPITQIPPVRLTGAPCQPQAKKPGLNYLEAALLELKEKKKLSSRR